MKTISIIIPCYNEAESLNNLYTELNKYLVPNYNFNILLVDDGSKDNTLSIIRELSKNDKNVKYLAFAKNFGKEAAMLAGLRLASQLDSDAVLIMDADLQHPPKLIPEMIKAYEAGCQHVYGRQKSRKKEPFLKTIFAKCFYKFFAMLTGNHNLNDGSGDFCLIDRHVVQALLDIKDYKRFTKGIFTWIGFEKKRIEYDYVPRAQGQTKWTIKKLYRYAMLGIKQFSHIYSLVPTLFLLVSFGFLGFDIYQWITKGFSFSELKIDLFIIMVAFSVKYIMKLIYDVRDQGLNRPSYVIKESHTDNEKPIQ